MRRWVIAALGIAGLVAISSAQAKADTFVLSNTPPSDCPYSPAVCLPLTGNGYATPVSGGFDLVGPDIGNPPTYPNQAFEYEDFGPSNTTTMIATAYHVEKLTYDWDYKTYDTFGTFFDPAGYVLDGVETLLSVGIPYDGSDNYPDQLGTITFTLKPGETYGFFVASGDSIEGPGTITFTLQSASFTGVPEPASWAIATLGLV